MESHEVISDAEKEEERYLKIFYEGSLKFVEIPLADDGRLLLTDVQAIEPNISALNLTKDDEYKRLCKPKNGCFKEPAEKWSSFNVFAILKTESVSYVEIKEIKQRKCVLILDSNIDECELTIITSTATETFMIKQETISSPHHVDESLPSSSVHSGYTSENESAPSTSIVADEMQLQNLPPEAQTKQTKKETSVKNDRNYYEFFKNVFVEQKKIKKFDNLKSYLIARIINAKLKLPFDDPLLISKFAFLNSNKKRHPNLKSIFPTSFICVKCNKNLQTCDSLVSHLFTRKHVPTALTQDELDKLIRAVSFIDYSTVRGFYYTFPKGK